VPAGSRHFRFVNSWGNPAGEGSAYRGCVTLFSTLPRVLTHTSGALTANRTTLIAIMATTAGFINDNAVLTLK